MAPRTGADHHYAGPRLPVGPKVEPPQTCIRVGVPGLVHDKPIRFELGRYGRRLAVIELCGACFQALVAPPNPDPLTVTEAA